MALPARRFQLQEGVHTGPIAPFAQGRARPEGLDQVLVVLSYRAAPVLTDTAQPVVFLLVVTASQEAPLPEVELDESVVGLGSSLGEHAAYRAVVAHPFHDDQVRPPLFGLPPDLVQHARQRIAPSIGADKGRTERDGGRHDPRLERCVARSSGSALVGCDARYRYACSDRAAVLSQNQRSRGYLV